MLQQTQQFDKYINTSAIKVKNNIAEKLEILYGNRQKFAHILLQAVYYKRFLTRENKDKFTGIKRHVDKNK